MPCEFVTTTLLMEPGGSAGAVACRLNSLMRLTPVAATPPTATVDPASNCMPFMMIGEPAGRPVRGDDWITIRCENSEVLPAALVAVALTRNPGLTASGVSSTLNAPTPEAFVVTGAVPIQRPPSRRSCGNRLQAGSS